jgi:outer membrane protein OmpA-like peptidoglycan-associated protein
VRPSWITRAAAALAFVISPARGEGPRPHAYAGLAHAVGDPQATELGFGGGGAVGVELPLSRIFGARAKLGVLALAKGDAPADPGLARRSTGTGLFATAGPRIAPLGGDAGPWVDAGVGLAATGPLARFAFEAGAGYDWSVSESAVNVGPFVGYTQIVQPADALRPEDAHVLWVGVHVGLGARAATPPRVALAPPPPSPPPPPPGGDRDADHVYDDEDACPDIAGVRTSDPKTNGCPRSDRDGDGVYDSEDACPDVPGPRTNDPKSNGCPTADEHVHVEQDKIVLDDVILFETDSPRVRHPSWALVKKLADFINANPDVLEVDIEGHTDSTGTGEHNLTLSKERADSVKKLLVMYGVTAERLTTRGFGENRPRATGHGEEVLRQNRRVAFTITRVRKPGGDAK